MLNKNGEIMNFIKTIVAVIAFIGFIGSANALVSPSANNIVLVGCTASSPTGATVYSVDSAILNGSATDELSLPTGVAAGNACGVALNALSGVTCATGKTWGVSGPVNVTISGSGYSLQQFTALCQ